MIERGGCSFLSKSIQAERAGARAVIVYDSDVSNDDSYIGECFSSTRSCTGSGSGEGVGAEYCP